MENYFPNVIRHSLDLLDELKLKPDTMGKKYKGLKEIIVQFLIKLITIMKEKVLIHLPLLHQYLKEDLFYRKMIENL